MRFTSLRTSLQTTPPAGSASIHDVSSSIVIRAFGSSEKGAPASGICVYVPADAPSSSGMSPDVDALPGTTQFLSATSPAVNPPNDAKYGRLVPPPWQPSQECASFV
jgi:hypothetical protein